MVRAVLLICHTEDHDVVIFYECGRAFEGEEDEPSSVKLSFMQYCFPNSKKVLQKFHSQENNDHYTDLIILHQTKERNSPSLSSVV